MEDLRTRLSRNLRKRRGQATYEQFARKLGISQASLHRLENRTQNVSIRTLQQLCRRLRCDIDELFKVE